MNTGPATRLRTVALAFFVTLILLEGAPPLRAGSILFSGDLRNNATVTDCGFQCTLGGANTDGDYAQWAAGVETFTVSAPSTMEAVTYSYGGGTSRTGAS